MSLLCNICGYKSTTKYNLSKHQKTESCQRIKINNDLLNKINELTTANNNLNIKIIDLMKELDNKQNLLFNKDTEIKLLQDKYEDLRKIVEKAATKATVKNNYTHNNYLNYISSEPLKLSEIKNKIKDVVNTKTIMWDDSDFHNHIVDNILKDDDGKDKVLCTDINRKNFSYKDEISGELICDPELERLREELRKGSDVKSLKRELLDKLIKKYDGTGTDPYKKFYEMLQKLEFGTPFVDHVAKKTYIKTKSEKTDKCDTNEKCEIDV
jgi:hypothetical protein